MIYLCHLCRRPLVEVWSGWARCECGWLTTQKPMPWDRKNRFAYGSQADPDIDTAQTASNTETGWEAYEGLSPLEARSADGDR